jgi:hypothetical protein
MIDEGCTSCIGGHRHDHRDHGGQCPHAWSSGALRSCCADVLAQEVGMRVAARELARGGGPADARELVPTVWVPTSPRWFDDPVGAVWETMPGGPLS